MKTLVVREIEAEVDVQLPLEEVEAISLASTKAVKALEIVHTCADAKEARAWMEDSAEEGVYDIIRQTEVGIAVSAQPIVKRSVGKGTRRTVVRAPKVTASPPEPPKSGGGGKGKK